MIETEVKGGGLKMRTQEEIDGDIVYPCRHQWRIIENFHTEFPRDQSKPRRYAAYCVYCLMSKGVEVKINK